MAEYVSPGTLTIVGSAHGKTNAWFFSPEDHRTVDNEADRIAHLKHILQSQSFLIPSSIQKLQPKDFSVSDISLVSLKKWSLGRVVLIGDAAHCLGPHAGIGTTMALEDAYVLAAELLKAERTGALEAAFVQYERLRRSRIARAKLLTQILRYGTLVKSKLLRAIMNIGIVYVPRRWLLYELEMLLKQEI